MNIEISALSAWMETQAHSLLAQQQKQVTNSEEATFFIKCEGALEMLASLDKAINRAKQHSESLGQEKAEGGEPEEEADRN